MRVLAVHAADLAIGGRRRSLTDLDRLAGLALLAARVNGSTITITSAAQLVPDLLNSTDRCQGPIAFSVSRAAWLLLNNQFRLTLLLLRF